MLCQPMTWRKKMKTTKITKESKKTPAMRQCRMGIVIGERERSLLRRFYYHYYYYYSRLKSNLQTIVPSR